MSNRKRKDEARATCRWRHKAIVPEKGDQTVVTGVGPMHAECQRLVVRTTMDNIERAKAEGRHS